MCHANSSETSEHQSKTTARSSAKYCITQHGQPYNVSVPNGAKSNPVQLYQAIYIITMNSS